MSEKTKDYISIDEENRQFAVKARDCNILLAAAAGSGKTTTLVNRIVDRLLFDENPVDIDNLLVVTFTRDAAAELRLRIDKELNNVFSRALEEGNHELAEKAYRQKLMLPKASIGTIDSFCLDVVQKNYLTAGIDPVFRIDTDEAKLIIEDATTSVLERWYSRKDSEDYRYLKEFVDIFCGVTSDQAFKDELLKKIYFFASDFGEPVEWLKKISDQYAADIDTKDENNIWYCYIRDTLYQACDEICEYIDQVVACIRGEAEIKEYAAFSDPSLVDTFFLDDKEIFENLKKILTESDEGIFSNALFIKLKGYSPQKIDEESLETFYALKVFREEYKAYFNNLRDSLIPGAKDSKTYKALSVEEKKDYFYSGIRAVGRYVEVLCRIVSEIVCETNEIMARRHIFNFNRVSALAYDILKDDSIAAQYREKFVEIYIDEYQDTSVMQENILQRISRAEEGIQNVFMVGDVKQSIYCFRNATPEYFVNKYNKYKDNPDEGKLRILTRNFRSRKNVLDAVNSVFSAVMKKGISDIEYTQEEALNYGAVKLYENNPLNDENDGKAELWICKKPGKKKKEDEEEEETSLLQTVYGDEALFVVDKIMDLFEKDFKVYDRDSNSMRPIRFADIAILARDNVDVSRISSVLRDFGIPAAAMSEELLLDKQEVITVLDFMKVVDNPYRDYPLVSLMTSEFFAFNDNEIALIRALSGKKSDNYYTSLMTVNREDFVSADGETIPETLKSKVRTFMETLDLYRHLAKVETLSRLTWLIMNHNGFYEKNSTEGKGNLRLLLDKTYPYDSGSEAGLYNFITYLESLVELNKAGFKAYVEDSGDHDKVHLLTLHKSKGLEFPVVFIINAGKTFYHTRQDGKVFINSKLGIGFTFISDKKEENLKIEEASVPMYALKHQKKREVFSEEQRLLYVAMTRAREKLFVTACCDKADYERFSSDYPSLASNVSIRTADNYISFILYALESAEGKNSWSVFKAGHSHKNLCDGKASDRINAIKRNMRVVKEIVSEEKAQSNERMLDEFYRDDEQLKTIQNMFSAVDGGRLPAKISVSAVKKVLADEDAKGSTSDFNSTKVKTLKETTEQKETAEDVPFSATQLGTLMHKCFEYLIKDRSYWPVGENSGAIEKYVASFVDGLLRKGILSETERKAVQLPFLIGFLRSDRAKEISKAEFACEEVPFTYLLNLDDMFSAEEKSRLDKNFGESSEKSVAIQGVIDLYYKTHDGKFVLADFKTDRLYAGNEELLKDKYSVQLRCYAKALESITGEKISESVLLFVREGKEFIYDHHNKAWRK